MSGWFARPENGTGYPRPTRYEHTPAKSVPHEISPCHRNRRFENEYVHRAVLCCPIGPTAQISKFCKVVITVTAETLTPKDVPKQSTDSPAEPT